MKTISIFLISTITVISVLGQTVSTVTINVRGNDNDAIIIDGKEYIVTTDYNRNTKVPIVVSNLQAGQHTLEIRRSDEVNPSSTVFTTRTGYDLHLTIAPNGSVQSRETKWRQDNTASYMAAMNSTDFNILYTTIRNKRAGLRMNLVSDAFANANYYFTTAQAKQLIELINGQSNRFALAKASYRSITDPVNFTEMYDVLNSQSYRDQLEAYVSNYNSGSSSTAINSTKFKTIYKTAQRQTTENSKISYIYNSFTNTNNYFTVSQARQLIQLVSTESNRLHLAKISYRSIIDRNNFSQMSGLLNKQASKNELRNFVNTYQDGNAVFTGVAMKEAEYNILYRDIQNRWGFGAKMDALTDLFSNENYYFTVAQAGQLIQLVSSESNRLELAKAAYNNIVDPANFNQLYNVLSGTSSRNELEAYVRDYQSIPESTTPVYTRTPMSTGSFNSLYNSVRNTWGIGAKMSKLTEIFEIENYFFTVTQAKQLIQLVSAESNRLQLAKSAYGNITDPENFNFIYDLLSSQTSRNELSAYVNSYSYSR